MSNFCFTIVAAACAALVLPMPAQAQVRTGDRAMSCEALAAEINQLAQADQPAAKPKKKRGGLGFLNMLSSAAPMLGSFGGNGMISGLAGQAAGMAQQQAMQGQMDDAMEASLNAMNPRQSAESQRKARLESLFDDKRC